MDRSSWPVTTYTSSTCIRSRRSSTRPGPATSTPPGSSTGSRPGGTFRRAAGSVRSPPPRSSPTSAPAPRPRWPSSREPSWRWDSRITPYPRGVDLPRYRTGDPDLDRAVAELVEEAGADPNSDLVFEMVVSALRLARDAADRGDLKVANGALKELRYAFSVFAPYRAERKVAIFGSARTEPDDPLYDQARRLAAALAERDWMVITGAGPGIMEAGLEGAGPEQSFGVSIRLPFEATTSQFIAGDPKLINFRYFFTRKLSFVKESHGFVLLPGGFGTLDEAFELLTLVQTGKTQPAPIVLLDVPDGTYWQSWKRFVEDELMARRLISPNDL